jgi:putative endonuclease
MLKTPIKKGLGFLFLEMIFYVYILYSPSYDTFYIGSSENPQERLKKHLANHKGFTSKAKDWVICYTESFAEKSVGLKREKQLKAWKNKTRIRQLVATAQG